ncbi:PIN domain-containing protein [Nitrospira sp. M1]
MSKAPLHTTPQTSKPSTSTSSNSHDHPMNATKSEPASTHQPPRIFHRQTIYLRLPFVVLGFLLGSALGWQIHPHNWSMVLGCGLGGLMLALTILAIESITFRYPASRIIQVAQSAGIGVLLASLFVWMITILFPASSTLVSFMTLASMLAFPYLTLSIKSRTPENTPQPSPEPWPWPLEEQATLPVKILDTSTIIDGRILDLYETGFLEGPVIIPRFVLLELHSVADSSQAWKRARGKRGLDILHHLQTLANIDVQVSEQDFADVPEVDHKLIKLAQHVHGKIVTNDWNLSKVAALQGVQTLNVNRLSYQLKPPVLPGDTIRVFINKEGDLDGQGVAHLDDGTMVVVDQARAYVQKTVDIVITKFMQTHTGRILFAARLEHEPDNPLSASHTSSLTPESRTYSRHSLVASGGTRKESYR